MCPVEALMSVPERDLLWQHYEMLVDLYKHYLDVTLKFNAFYYFITGAILSYYFAESSNPMMRWTLLFPIFMSAAFALFFFYGAGLHGNARKEVARVAQILGLQVWPDVGVPPCRDRDWISFLCYWVAINRQPHSMVQHGLTKGDHESYHSSDEADAVNPAGPALFRSVLQRVCLCAPDSIRP
jgi:hypothetical protein